MWRSLVAGQDADAARLLRSGTEIHVYSGPSTPSTHQRNRASRDHAKPAGHLSCGSDVQVPIGRGRRGCHDVWVAYHHGGLPAALLASVEEAVAECGVSGVSLRDVARRAGVSHGAPAHHFGSKAGLLTAFAVQGHRLLVQAILEEMAGLGTADPAAEAAAMGQGYVRFAVRHRAHFEVMYRQDMLLPGDRDLEAARDGLYELLDGAIGRARAQGRLPSDRPEIAVVAGWSLAHGLAALWNSGRITDRTGEHDPQRIAAAVTALFTRAIMPPPQPAAPPALSPDIPGRAAP